MQHMTKKEAKHMLEKYAGNRPEQLFLLTNNLDEKSEHLKFVCNIESLYKNFYNLPYFNEHLRCSLETVYHIRGGKSKTYDFK